MYISNTTKQRLQLNLRVPESRKILVVDIPSGHQVDVGTDWSPPQLASVVQYLERFGARSVSSIHETLSDFSGILYSLDKAVKVDRIETAHAKVVDRQTQVASDELTKSALGADAATRDQKTKRRRAKRTTMQVTQDLPRGVKPSGHEVAFALTVDPDGKDSPGLS